MTVKLKPVGQQVIVITGATSGIGLATARLAASKGARLMLVARDEEALTALARQLGDQGALVEYTVADVSNAEQLQAAADKAIARFGGFDTWVNNAGASIFGRCADVPIDEQKELFETNFWGVVQGSMIALAHLRQRGGALINLGSELSDIALPLQAAYVASKHAVKGYTDALRMELLEERAPVSVTLIKPSGIHTQFVEHARNHLDVQPKLPAPVYAPDIVAKAILHAAATPVRDLYVGGASAAMVTFARRAPNLYDRVMGRLGISSQRTQEPPHTAAGTSGGDGALRERSEQKRRVLESSLYTQASMYPRQTALLAAGAAAVWMLARYARSSHGGRV
ncbi:SDR family oxidoreductase [Paraburkholderia kirstenboschensis]|uniref:SDR family oxidoreductase n=1 Tax=Paraburkholderia kirstenboschensis TaxID=1245436 RepID=A0ABZ0EIT0_9BURK|nr:SDR family oxidoreductase [Paraburkholderia kirstenboschensis]WOD16013.1 SDR family oxidoreductase [Paraburkholderia kirstenboschensis]